MLKSLKFGGVSRVKNPRVSKTLVDHVIVFHLGHLLKVYDISITLNDIVKDMNSFIMLLG